MREKLPRGGLSPFASRGEMDEDRKMDLTGMGRILLVLGGLLAVLGLVLLLAGRIPFLGQLPGDITLSRGNVSCYIPIVTSILLSLLLTLILNLVIRLLAR